MIFKILTPSLPQPIKFLPANSIFDGPITNLFAVLCILTVIFSPAHAKGKKVFNDSKFGAFIGHFQSDGAASMAMKGLIFMKLLPKLS